MQLSIFVKALVWTFIHSLWQGLVAAIIASIIISVTKKAKASLRYNLLGITLGLFLVATIITCLLEISSARPNEFINSAVANYNIEDTSTSGGGELS